MNRNENTVAGRMFEQIRDLIPNLNQLRVGDSLIAPPRLKGDCAIQFNVVQAQGNSLLIELADEKVMPAGEVSASPTLQILVNKQEAVAEVEKMHVNVGGRLSYYGREDTRRKSQVNLYAVSWLRVLLNCHIAFEPAADVVDVELVGVAE